jgi:hypothetical protein
VPLAAAAALAAWGIGFGLPYLFRPDEDVMVGRAVHLASDHSLDPLFYNYPPLGFYLLGAAEAVLGLLPGRHLGPATQVDPSAEYLAGRLVSALALVAAVAVTYLAGRRAYGCPAGLLAAAALAVAPLAVRQAHFATGDGIATALAAASLWLALRAKTPAAFAVAGLAAGLAAATKYTAGAVLVFVLVLALLEGGERRDRAAAALAAVAGAALPVAGLLVTGGHLPEYVRGLAFLGGRAGASYQGLPAGWLYHPTVSLPFGLGPGAYAMALGGLVLALVRRQPVDVALVAFVLVYGCLVGFSHEVFFRYVLPVLPALCLLAGGLTRLVRPGPQAAVGAAAALLLLAPGAAASISGDRLLGQTDTRGQAADWLLANAPPGSEVRVDSYWVQPFYDSAELESRPLHPLYVTGNRTADSFEPGRFSDRFHTGRPGRPCFRVLTSGPPWQGPPPEAGRAPSARFQPYAGTAPPSGVYDPLDAFYLPLWGFGSLQRPGPSIAIVRDC